MRPPKQKQPQVKKGLCRVLEHVDVDVDVERLSSKQEVMGSNPIGALRSVYLILSWSGCTFLQLSNTISLE